MTKENEKDNARQRFPTETRQRELLDIAERLCAEQGPECLKLREVARQAGISAPSVYNHFASLDDLLAALIARRMADLAEVYAEVANLPADEAMEQVCKTHVEIYAANPGSTRLILADFHTPHGIEAVDKAEDDVDVINDLDRDLILRGQKEKLFRKVKPHDVTIARIGMSLVLLSDRWFDSQQLTRREIKQCASTVADYTLRLLSIR